jgi:hypothetical protein
VSFGSRCRSTFWNHDERNARAEKQRRGRGPEVVEADGNAILGYVTTSVAKFDRFYDPNSDGVLSLTR